MAVFNLLTSLIGLQRLDLEAANPDILTPSNPVASDGILENGQWICLDDNYRALVFKPAADAGTPKGGSAASLALYQVFAENGRSDVQAIGKVPVILNGAYEMETDQFVADPTIITDIAPGARAAYTVGAALTIVPVEYKDAAAATNNGAGILCTALAGDPIVGYVTKIPSSNNNLLRAEINIR